MPLKSKLPSESYVETNQIVLPSHSNSMGTIFGGVLLSWIDIAAAICAQRHSDTEVVTAGVDAVYFLNPARTGDTINLKARVVHTGKTSMVVVVDAKVLNPMKKISKDCVTAHLSFVALNAKQKPTLVPSLSLKTRKEKEEFEQAAERRKEHLLWLKSHAKLSKVGRNP